MSPRRSTDSLGRDLRALGSLKPNRKTKSRVYQAVRQGAGPSQKGRDGARGRFRGWFRKFRMSHLALVAVVAVILVPLVLTAGAPGHPLTRIQEAITGKSEETAEPRGPAPAIIPTPAAPDPSARTETSERQPGPASAVAGYRYRPMDQSGSGEVQATDRLSDIQGQAESALNRLHRRVRNLFGF